MFCDPLLLWGILRNQNKPKFTYAKFVKVLGVSQTEKDTLGIRGWYNFV